MEEPHSGRQHNTSEAVSRGLPVPEQRGVKRDWHDAEASDSPQQNNTKVRPAVESADGPHLQGQDCSSGVASNKLAVPEQPEMEVDGCNVEASDPPHQDKTEVRSESAYEPDRQPHDGSSGAEPSCLPREDNTEARL
jgi:senataxin